MTRKHFLILSGTINFRIMKHLQRSLLGLLFTTFILTGCGNIDIVKRRHMPGYHVELNRNVKQAKPAKEDMQQARAEQNFETAEVREAQVETTAPEQEVITTSAAPVATSALVTKPKAASTSTTTTALDRGMEFFKHELAATRTALKPSPVNRNTHWMAWVAFGAGLASSLFGLIGLIVAFFGIPMWWLAILFGVTAIVFAIIHAKNNYQGETFRRLGLLFGIIGASLGLIGLIIWALRSAAVFVV
jgi:hypothetical protein